MNSKVKTLALALGAGILAGENLSKIGSIPQPLLVDDLPPVRTRAKRFKKHLSEYVTPPVSMSEGTKYLYSKKPNIQYWQNLHGENVIDKSVSELQAMGI